MKQIIVTDRAIDSQQMKFDVWAPDCGAVVTFEGIVRDHDSGRSVFAMTYEMYVSMAKKELEKIADETLQKFQGVRVALAHRSGRLLVGEPSVVVVAAAPHRNEAFLAARYAIDELKKRGPIWKKEETTDGTFWKDEPNRVQPSNCKTGN